MINWHKAGFSNPSVNTASVLTTRDSYDQSVQFVDKRHIKIRSDKGKPKREGASVITVVTNTCSFECSLRDHRIVLFCQE